MTSPSPGATSAIAVSGTITLHLARQCKSMVGVYKTDHPELAGFEVAASNAVSAASEHRRRAGGRAGVRAAPGWGSTHREHRLPGLQ